MKAIFRSSIILFIALTLICAVLYPLVVTGIGQLVFPHQVNGSMVLRDEKPIGSLLIGQAFSSPKYFWGRPSATTPMPNNGTASGGSNLGPLNPELINVIKQRITNIKATDPSNNMPIPVDLVTASASGLDPEISVAAAYYQADRIARERKLTVTKVHEIIDRNKQPQYFGFSGEPRVNVLALNLVLDQQSQ